MKITVKMKIYNILGLVLLIFCSTILFSQTYIENAAALASTFELKDYVVINGEQHILVEVSGENFPVTDGSTFFGSGIDVGYAKIDTNGDIVMATQFGGQEGDNPLRILVQDGIVHVMVEHQSTTISATPYPFTDGTSLPTSNQRRVAYTQIDEATGGIIFSTGFQGDDAINGVDMAIIGDKIHFLGTTEASDFFTTDGSTLNGNSDMFYRVYDINTKVIVYSALIGGSGDEENPGMKFQDGKLHILVNGENDFPTTDGTAATTDGFPSVFYVQIDPTTNNIDFSGYVAPGVPNANGTNRSGDFIVDGDDLHIVTQMSYFTFVFFPVFSIEPIPGLPTTTGVPSNGTTDYYYTRYDLATKQIAATTHVGGSAESPPVGLDVYNGKAHIVISDAQPPFENSISGDPTQGSNIVYYRLDENAYAEIARVVSGNGSDYRGGIEVNDDGVFIFGATTSTDLSMTDPQIQKGGHDVFISKFDHSTGDLLFSTRLSSSLDDFLGTNDIGSLNVPFFHVDEDRIFISGVYEGPDFPVTAPEYSGIVHPGVQSNDFEVFATVFRICSDIPFDFTSDDLSPSTQTNCRGGVVEQILGSQITIDPNLLPTIYENGIPRNQTLIEAVYQWEFATASGGPWTAIEGATEQNYSPPPAFTDRYYRRISRKRACCDNELISTSSVAAALVSVDEAPTVNAGGIFNTCAGNAVTIGIVNGTSGGTPPYTFSWDQGAGNSETASVSPSVTTVYTLTVTDANGCEQIDQCIVNVYAANAGADRSSCENTPVRIGTPPIPGLAGVTYSWDNGGTLSCTDCAQPTASPNSVTTYTLMMTIPITGGGTCTTSSSVTITPIAAPTSSDFAGLDVVICQGATATIGTTTEGGFNYTWAPGNYLVDNDEAMVEFDPGSLEMPAPNPIRYYVTAEQNGCTFVDEMIAAVITADAGVDGCGPRRVGEEDSTPNITETYAWTKISGPGNIIGPDNIPQPTVSQSVGGTTIYEVSVSYNGTTCIDQVEVPDCGCFVDIEVEAPFDCPSFGLNGGNVNLIAFAADIFSQDPDEFTYSWSPSTGLSADDQRIVTLTDNVERTYTVTMASPYDASFMCTQDITVNRPSWSLPVFTPGSVQTCANAPVQIGAPPVAGYDYTWSNASALNNHKLSNPTATVLSNTNFTVTVLDIGSGCTTEETVTVVAPIAADAGTDKVVCDNGVIELGENMEAAGYTYSWSPAGASWQNGTDQNSAQPQVIVAVDQTFSLTVTQTASGCTSSDAVDVVVGNPVPAFTLSDVSFCPSDASLQIGAGVPNGYSYFWTPSSLLDDETSQMPNLITPLPSTGITFQLTVGDLSGCNYVATQRIVPNVNPPDAGTTQTACIGETVSLGSASNPTGGGISYTWSPTTNLSPSNTPLTTFTPTSSGTFTFTLEKNEGGCVSRSNVTIFVNEADLPTFTNPTVCTGGCVEIGATPESGISYQWSPSASLSDATIANPIACPTETTLYTLTATFDNGCILTETVLVSVNNENAPTLGMTNQIVCLGTGGISFTPTVSPNVGNYTYEWSPDDGTVANIYDPDSEIFAIGFGTQSYTLTIVDLDNGCSTSEAVDLQIFNCITPPMPPCITPNATVAGMIGTCAGSSPNNDASVLLSAVTEGEEANYSIGISYTGTAYGDAGNINVSSGSGMFNGLMHNTQYTIRIFNGANDCFVDYTVTTPSITCNSCLLSVVCSKTDLTNCTPLNGAISAVVSGNQGNLTYNWANSSGIQVGTTASVSNLPAGVYSLTVTDDFTAACSTTCTLEIIDNAGTPTAVCSATDNTNCATPNGAASVTTNASNPTYLWSNGMTASSLMSLSNGTYTVTVTDGITGCTNECTAMVGSTIALPSALCSATDNTNCATPNGTASVMTNASNPSYLWSNGMTASSLMSLSNGTYTVTVTDGTTGCTNECNAIVNNTNTPPSLSCNKIDNTSCTNPNGSISSMAMNVSYLWSTGATTAMIGNLSAGMYSLTVTDLTSGCTAECSETILDPVAPTCAVSTGSQPTCVALDGGAATANPIGGIAPYTYLWSDASGQTTQTATGLEGGMYTVTVTDVNNCTTTCSITLDTPIACCPEITNPSATQTICEGQMITSLSINTDADSPDQIEFVYFSSQQIGNAMYTGGISLGIVNPSAGSASISNVGFPMAGIYYVYAIISPIPTDSACRPFQEIQVVVNALPNISLMVSDPIICDGEPAPVIIFSSEIGLTYQLRNNADNSLIGTPVMGNGGDITLMIEGLTPNNYTYNILAASGSTGCQAELSNRANVTVTACDFPDFPPPICEIPACHAITADIYFGAGVTPDPPGNGDSTASTDIDDGISFPNNIRRNIDIRLPITFYNNTGNPAFIQGWIDWDGDMNFDADEQVTNLTIPFDGSNLTQTISHSVSVPTDAIQDVAVAVRFRISSDPVILSAPCGMATCAADGEVEDYLIRLECPEEICLPIQVNILRGD